MPAVTMTLVLAAFLRLQSSAELLQLGARAGKLRLAAGIILADGKLGNTLSHNDFIQR
jgi:hypothetical protein